MRKIVMSRSHYFFLATMLSILLYGVPAAAQIYEWIDAEGTQHFSTSKPEEEAELADLPLITREKSLRAKPAAASCVDHGGINCGEGPDSDGSVICYDGFRGATPRYRFSCFNAKVEVTEILNGAEPGSYKIVVRNMLSVPAKGVLLSFQDAEGDEHLAEGPHELDALAMGEYLFPKQLPSAPEKARITVSCTNCQ
jgi:Domain of unknown function (DUF4124)